MNRWRRWRVVTTARSFFLRRTRSRIFIGRTSTSLNSSLGHLITRYRRATHDVRRVVFDARWYSRMYGPLPDNDDALVHYLEEGWRLGYRPSPVFDAQWYVTTHQMPSGISPLEHYIRHPFRGRLNRYFDPGLWLRQARKPGEDVYAFLAGLSHDDDPRLYDTRLECASAVHRGVEALDDGEPVCVFAHFDPDGVVDPHVVATITCLARAGCRTVFCSTSPRLQPRGIEALAPTTAYILQVPNTGYDWGSYHAGLRFVLDRVSPGSVTLMNDSVYVHHRLFGPFLAGVLKSKGDLVGATDSLELEYHLQSYFLHFTERMVSSRAVTEFLEHYVPIADRRYVINAYEIGFSRRVRELGLQLRAMFEYADLASHVTEDSTHDASGPDVEAREALNPTHYLWDTLLTHGYPFVKVDLLRWNPESRPNLEKVDEFLPTDEMEMIRRHLSRIDHDPRVTLTR